MGRDVEITGLLIAFRLGDRAAMGDLFERVYHELRVMARGRIGRGGQRPIDTTALVHEAYIRLVDQSRAELQDRRHFFAVAAMAMRQIVVDHARAAAAAKRGGDAVHVSVNDDAAGKSDLGTVDLIALDDALARLKELGPRLCQVVELRFFVGLSVEETAEVLEVTPRTVKRDWRKARALLFEELGSSAKSDA